MIGHEFPYTNLHDVNIDWILQVVKEFNEKYHGIDDAIDAAIASLNATADELETAMSEYMQGLEEETTANINAIYAQFQTEANEAVQAIIGNKELALSAIDSEMNSKLAQVSTLLNSLPHDYQDALNSMQIINATLNGTNNYPELVQGHYADSQESDSKTLVDDNYRVSSLLSAGCASRRLRTRVTNANGIIRDIIYWTGWGDSAVSHPVPVSTSTSDEKTLFTYTFPADATYFTVVFASDYNMLTAITPSDLQVEFQWIFDSLETLEIDDETDTSGNSDGFILSKDGDNLSSWTAGTEKTHMDVGHTTGTIRHYFKDEQARDNVGELKTTLHNELYGSTVNDIATFTIVQGERVTQADGSFEEIANWERSNYIDIEGYIGLSVETEYTLWNCAIYKSDYTMLSFVSIAPDTGTILLPANAKYFVMSVMSPRLTGVNVSLIRASYNSKIDARFTELSYKAEYTIIPAEYSFVQGSLSSVDGSIDTSSARRISSTFIPIETAKIPIHIDVKYQSNLFFYSSETRGYISNIGFRDGDYTIGEDVQIPNGATLIRVCLRNKANPNSNISPSDIQTGEVTVQYISPKVDETELAKYNELFVPPALPNIMWVCRDSRVRNDVPPNSPQAIKLTAYNQYDRVRFSVTKTVDGEYVAVHDVTINGLAVNPDGTPISGTINTADCTLAQLNAYDWGLKFGAQYAGMTVPMLNDCLKIASIYGLRVALDIKWTVDDNDIDALTAMLAKYGQTDAIFFAVNPTNAAKFKAKNKRFSYLYAGTYEQMQTQVNNLLALLTGYNKVYLAVRPLGTAPTTNIINFACVNNFDIMYSPIEGMSELITLGFDKGITLMECHYIENIKKTVMNYADSLIE